MTPLEATYAGTYRKMTLALLTNFFDNEVLKVSSVTGKGETGKEGRKALDKDTVQYIIGRINSLDHVKNLPVFANITKSQISLQIMFKQDFQVLLPRKLKLQWPRNVNIYDNRKRELLPKLMQMMMMKALKIDVHINRTLTN